VKVRVDAKELAAALGKLQRVIPKKSAVLVLEDVLVRASAEGLVLEGASGERFLAEAKAKGDVAKEGTATIPYWPLLKLVGKIPTGTEITVRDDSGDERVYLSWSVQGRESQASLGAVDLADEFPRRPVKEPEGQAILQFDGDEFRSLLRNTLPFVAKEEDRPVLLCVHFKAEGGELVVESADGFRATRVERPVCETKEFDVLVPAGALDKIVKACRKSEWFTLGVVQDGDDEYVRIETEGVTFWILQEKGEFVKLKEVIERTGSGVVVRLGSRGKLEDTVKMVVDLSELPSVYLSVKSEEVLEVKSNHHEEVKLSTEIEAEISDWGGEEYQTAVNGKYLLDVLKVLGRKEELTIRFPSRKGNAFLLERAGDPGWRHVLMPMRVRD